MVSMVASQQEGTMFNSHHGNSLCMFFLCLPGFLAGYPVSFPQVKRRIYSEHHNPLHSAHFFVNLVLYIFSLKENNENYVVTPFLPPKLRRDVRGHSKVLTHRTLKTMQFAQSQFYICLHITQS